MGRPLKPTGTKVKGYFEDIGHTLSLAEGEIVRIFSNPDVDLPPLVRKQLGVVFSKIQTAKRVATMAASERIGDV